jgi:hypothetical protein
MCNIRRLSVLSIKIPQTLEEAGGFQKMFY